MKRTFLLKNLQLLLSILVILLMSSCSQIHDDIYGEQKITVTNNQASIITIEIFSINDKESKILGDVKALSSKTFHITFRNDCSYKFKAYQNDKFLSQKTLNTCGGVEWEV